MNSPKGFIQVYWWEYEIFEIIVNFKVKVTKDSKK